ncbi:hypothetical protein CAEBREN_09786 [Caenorhabditis brenneri]|uniref:Uncharacterized protein n=1 Tax=Caenorhabditis brenneri TaxID=135651 RepID=G0P3S2_CAEBE|nr:hypothetical protein CAEBREN_09786 [Caenorhabditis brenneri]
MRMCTTPLKNHD